jgi:hypothetical protein
LIETAAPFKTAAVIVKKVILHQLKEKYVRIKANTYRDIVGD